MSDYDVIIIGTGAGGGTLARHLAPSGKKILLLERGGWLPREPQNWSTADVFEDGRYISPDTWYDAKGKTFQPQVHYYVGGATKLYGAALYRLREKDFGELKYPDGISPAWPIEYGDMEPYYMMAESHYRFRVAGARTPPSRPRAPPIRSRRCRTSRGSSNCPTTSPLRASTPSMRRAACSGTTTRRRRASASAAGSATASRARCTPSPTPR